MTQTYERTTTSNYEGDSTVGREVIELPSLVIDEFATHSALNEKLDMLHVDGSLTGNLDIERDELIQGITDDSHDLAAQILPKEVSEDLGIHARVGDNAGFHHPPKLHDVELLGYAWDATGDDTTLQAIKLAIPKVASPEAPVAKKAIESAEKGEGSFRENYLQGIEQRLVRDATREFGSRATISSFDDINGVKNPDLKRDINIAVSDRLDNYVTVQTTTAYIDTNPAAPSYADYTARKNALRDDLRPIDEVEERLVRPLAFPDVELEQVVQTGETDHDGRVVETGARIDVPMILLPDKEIINNIRVRRLTEAARNEAIAARDADIAKKVWSMRDAIHTSRGITPED